MGFILFHILWKLRIFHNFGENYFTFVADKIFHEKKFEFAWPRKRAKSNDVAFVIANLLKTNANCAVTRKSYQEKGCACEYESE